MRDWVSTVVVALVLTLLLLPGVSHALTAEQKVLVGLKGVFVFVESTQPEQPRVGLTKDQIRTDVELRLRKAGVRVLTEEERLQMPGMPYLFVMAETHFPEERTSDAGGGFVVRLELRERVMLARGIKARLGYGTQEA